jgi:hypothetical protein
MAPSSGSSWIYAITTEMAEYDSYYALALTTMSIMGAPRIQRYTPRRENPGAFHANFDWTKCGIDVVKNDDLRYK